MSDLEKPLPPHDAVLLPKPELDALRAENERLRAQVTELQETMTRMHLTRQADDLFCQVWEFQSAMKIPCFIGPPWIPDTHRIKNRLTLSAEEFFEQLQACFPINPALRDAVTDEIRYCTPRVDLPELVDSWCDMNYIHQGSAIEFGVDLKPIARAVHAANMAKLGGRVREDGKVLKPPGWQAPDVGRLLREQGWRG